MTDETEQTEVTEGEAPVAEESLQDGMEQAIAEALEQAEEPAGEPEPEAPPAPEPPAAQREPEEAGGDDLPPDASERTRERFHRLSGELKTTKEQLNNLLSVIQRTGASPEDFGRAMAILKGAASQNQEEARQALQMVEAMRQGIARRIGAEVPGYDPLSEHPDLAQEVDNLERTRESALREAQQRRQLAAYEQQMRQVQQYQQQAYQRQQAEQQASVRLEAAKQQLNDLEAELRARDVDYDEKRKVLAVGLADIARAYRPEDWATVYRQRYSELSATLPSKPRGNSPRPLSAGSVGPGGPAEPKSLEDAVEQALAAMR